MVTEHSLGMILVWVMIYVIGHGTNSIIQCHIN
jgi:hypothetical protein